MLNLVSVSHNLKVRPSELMGIIDPYTAYCLDEACSYILAKLENGEEPRFEKKYTSFSELYRQYGM